MRKGWSLRASADARLEAIRKADESLGDLLLQIPERLQLKLSCLDMWQAHFYLTHYNFILLLHRPPPNSRKNSSGETQEDAILCREATVAIASIFEVVLSNKFVSSLWLYSNHVVFTATIHIINEIGISKPLLAAKSRHILDTFLKSLRELANYWTFARGLLQVLEKRALKPRGEREYGLSAPNPNLQLETSSFEQPTGGLSVWTGNDSGLLTDSNADLADPDSDAYTAIGSHNTNMDFLMVGQDPSLNDLFLIDTSTFDFLFSDTMR